MTHSIEATEPTFLKSWGAIVIRYAFKSENHIGMFVLGENHYVENQPIITSRITRYEQLKHPTIHGIVTSDTDKHFRLLNTQVNSFNDFAPELIAQLEMETGFPISKLLDKTANENTDLNAIYDKNGKLMMIECKDKRNALQFMPSDLIEKMLDSTVHWQPARLIKVCRNQEDSRDDMSDEETWDMLAKRRKLLNERKWPSKSKKASVIREPYANSSESDEQDSQSHEFIEADHPFIQVSPKMLPIFADKRLNENLKKPPAASRINEDNFSDIMSIIQKRGTKRDMLQLKADQQSALTDALDLLSKEMPNFAQVVEHVKNNLLFACHGDRNVYFPPILLAGPPGIGKTLFASKLAKVLRLPYHYLAMENQIGNGSLVGTQAMYNNSRPGLVYNLLVQGEVANPLILLDEIEKAGSDSKNGGTVVNQLLSLLEKHSAQNFEDQSVEGLAFDASWVNWILTANDLNLLPAPVISRTTLFNIQPPSEEELPHIIDSIYQKLLDERCVVAEKRLPISDTAIQGLARMVSHGNKGLRDLRALLQNAFIRAIQSGQTEISNAQLGIDDGMGRNKERLKIGFL